MLSKETQSTPVTEHENTGPVVRGIIRPMHCNPEHCYNEREDIMKTAIRRMGTTTCARLIVAPMTPGSKPAPYRIALRFRGKNGLVLLDQIRTLDKTRLAARLGTVEPKTLQAMLDTLRQMFAD